MDFSKCILQASSVAVQCICARAAARDAYVGVLTSIQRLLS
jgi:hypothetical protein